MASFSHRFQREKPVPVPGWQREFCLPKRAERVAGQYSVGKSCIHVIVKMTHEPASSSRFLVICGAFQNGPSPRFFGELGIVMHN